MKNIYAAFLGLAGGFVAGSVFGISRSKKIIKELSKEIDERKEVELFYEEQFDILSDKITSLTNRMNEAATKTEVKSIVEECEYCTVDDAIDDDEWDEVDDDIPQKAEPVNILKNDKIHKLEDYEEAEELISEKHAALEELCMFYCGTITKSDMETPVIDAGRFVGYDVIDNLKEAVQDEDRALEFPSFIYNEANNTVYQIFRDPRKYSSYMATV